eukprot:m.137637 g.137637  ORF g.137637 m.137637 type:complete len:114 (-) comp13149_c0_seq4:2135-2476(-)
MSWTSQAENLVATGKVTSSAIFGLDGVKWGGTEGFEPIGTEIQYILNALDDEQTAVLLPKVGVTIGGKKYTYLRRGVSKHSLSLTVLLQSVRVRVRVHVCVCEYVFSMRNYCC